MRFYGKEKQDRFAYYLIGEVGSFLDVGCYHPVMWNNTKALENAGWSGLIFDIEDKWIKMAQEHRTNKSFCVDTTSSEFKDILNKEMKSNSLVDYISVDVDEASIETLCALVEQNVRFKCMTFEHCLFEDPKQKNISKHLLSEEGYIPLFENVLCDLSHDGYQKPQPFEDWWIDLKHFDESILEIQSKNIFFEDCINKLMEYVHDNG